jgi:hypothetical protein
VKKQRDALPLPRELKFSGTKPSLVEYRQALVQASEYPSRPQVDDNNRYLPVETPELKQYLEARRDIVAQVKELPQYKPLFAKDDKWLRQPLRGLWRIRSIPSISREADEEALSDDESLGRTLSRSRHFAAVSEGVANAALQRASEKDKRRAAKAISAASADARTEATSSSTAAAATAATVGSSRRRDLAEDERSTSSSSSEAERVPISSSRDVEYEEMAPPLWTKRQLAMMAAGRHPDAPDGYIVPFDLDLIPSGPDEEEIVFRSSSDDESADNSTFDAAKALAKLEAEEKAILADVSDKETGKVDYIHEESSGLDFTTSDDVSSSDILEDELELSGAEKVSSSSSSSSSDDTTLRRTESREERRKRRLDREERQALQPHGNIVVKLGDQWVDSALIKQRVDRLDRAIKKITKSSKDGEPVWMSMDPDQDQPGNAAYSDLNGSDHETLSSDIESKGMLWDAYEEVWFNPNDPLHNSPPRGPYIYHAPATVEEALERAAERKEQGLPMEVVPSRLEMKYQKKVYQEWLALAYKHRDARLAAVKTREQTRQRQRNDQMLKVIEEFGEDGSADVKTDAKTSGKSEKSKLLERWAAIDATRAQLLKHRLAKRDVTALPIEQDEEELLQKLEVQAYEEGIVEPETFYYQGRPVLKHIPALEEAKFTGEDVYQSGVNLAVENEEVSSDDNNIEKSSSGSDVEELDENGVALSSGTDKDDALVDQLLAELSGKGKKAVGASSDDSTHNEIYEDPPEKWDYDMFEAPPKQKGAKQSGDKDGKEGGEGKGEGEGRSNFDGPSRPFDMDKPITEHDKRVDRQLRMAQADAQLMDAIHIPDPTDVALSKVDNDVKREWFMDWARLRFPGLNHKKFEAMFKAYENDEEAQERLWEETGDGIIAEIDAKRRSRGVETKDDTNDVTSTGRRRAFHDEFPPNEPHSESMELQRANDAWDADYIARTERQNGEAGAGERADLTGRILSVEEWNSLLEDPDMDADEKKDYEILFPKVAEEETEVGMNPKKAAKLAAIRAAQHAKTDEEATLAAVAADAETKAQEAAPAATEETAATTEASGEAKTDAAAAPATEGEAQTKSEVAAEALAEAEAGAGDAAAPVVVAAPDPIKLIYDEAIREGLVEPYPEPELSEEEKKKIEEKKAEDAKKAEENKDKKSVDSRLAPLKAKLPEQARRMRWMERELLKRRAEVLKELLAELEKPDDERDIEAFTEEQKGALERIKARQMVREREETKKLAENPLKMLYFRKMDELSHDVVPEPLGPSNITDASKIIDEFKQKEGEKEAWDLLGMSPAGFLQRRIHLAKQVGLREEFGLSLRVEETPEELERRRQFQVQVASECGWYQRRVDFPDPYQIEDTDYYTENYHLEDK